jgi:excisionase family DNA binding protein
MPSALQAPEEKFAPRIGRSVSLDHAAELLGVSRRTIYNRIREGRLQTIRTLGGSQRVILDATTGAVKDGFKDDATTRDPQTERSWP